MKFSENSDSAARLERLSTFAQPFTGELLAKAGIAPGMRVINLGAQAGDAAFQIADRVGASGCVLGIDNDENLIETARSRAHDQCLRHVTFRAQRLSDLAVHAPVDAVIARFYLSEQRDPVDAIRSAASLVRPGGRIIFQEWHWGSMLWTHQLEYPQPLVYKEFAERAIDALERNGTHVNMGLQLVGALLAAGLPVPTLRTDLRAVTGPDRGGFTFFEDSFSELLPDASRFARRLERETIATGGHVFFPLQVGAWVRAGL